VEYETSGADEIDAKFDLEALGTKRMALLDGSEVITDIYAQLENDMPEIEAGTPDTSTVTFTVMDNTTTPAPVVGATLKLINRQSDDELTAVAPTDASGQCTVNTVPYGWYDIELKDSEETILDTTPSYVSINENTESKDITANIN
jgi:hypothetical protein